MPKQCIACGMPMTDEEDFPMGDRDKAYCIHCSRPDGTMQSFEEKLESLTQFIVRTQGFDARAAESSALTMMRRLPAWRDSDLFST